jgi:hypothetical protein
MRKKLQLDQLRDFLNEKAWQYNNKNFIESDPISIPHRFSLKQDIEIAAFFAATLAWGQRVTIINKCSRVVADDGQPSLMIFYCIINLNDLKPFAKI